MRKRSKTVRRVVIDGVMCIPSGMNYKDTRCKNIPQWLYFDMKTGNLFYTNCDSTQIAEEVIKKLKEKRNIDAVIGPKGPWLNNRGEPFRNPKENCVAVYFVGNELAKYV